MATDTVQWVYVHLVRGEDEWHPGLYRKQEVKLTSTEVALLKQPASFKLGMLIDCAIDRDARRGRGEDDVFKDTYIDYQEVLVNAKLMLTYKDIRDDFKGWERLSYGTFTDCSRLIVLNCVIDDEKYDEDDDDEDDEEEDEDDEDDDDD